MADRPGLLACPFCGHQHAPMLTDSRDFQDQIGGEFDESNEVYFAVVCDASSPGGRGGCGAMGGFAPTEAAAIEAWNRRTAPAPGGEVVKQIDRILCITSATPALTEAQLGEAMALIQRAAERARAAIAGAERAKP